MKIIFWIAVTADVMILMLLFVLGLAAAPSSHSSVFDVAGFMLIVPGLLLAASILLFTRTTSPAWRGVAILLAASPWLVVFSLKEYATAKFRMNADSQGKMTYFRSGPMRDIAAAISRNDAPGIASLAKGVDLNGRGYGDMTLLLYALRQLKQTPHRTECLRTLLSTGADPNLGAYELPLEIAIRQSPGSGPEPVEMLLTAGANPNRKGYFGTPAYFAATGVTIDIEILKLVLDHGAELNARARNGEPAVIQAANNGNWNAVLLLLQRGADWKNIRAPSGLTLRDMAESYTRVYGDRQGLASVIAYLQQQR